MTAMTAYSEHIGVTIERPVEVVYAFAADPSNLPRWAAGLSAAIAEDSDGRWIADSPMGKVVVEFAPRNAYGVLDHIVTLESGERVDNPVRVVANGGGSDVVVTVRKRSGMSRDDFARDVAAVRADLEKLKQLLEDGIA